ncbi:MAG: prepilin-type N-terminal cleavage/methylation domain-containing protein [Desulforhopalus sp.]|nr:prepilin-type N-terminal cleavage/methylation domain-containing protein [Desulforhopalus sp.]
MCRVNSNSVGNPPAATRHHQGFTLVEVLIAVFIFSLVMASVYGAYRATFAVVHGSEHEVMLADRGGFILSRLSDDLDSLVLGKNSYLRGEEHSVSGARSDSIAFLSSARIILGKSDLPQGRLLIIYTAEPDDRTGLLQLYRTETEVLPGVKLGEGPSRKHLLASGLKEVRFVYQDEGGSHTSHWQKGGNDVDQGQETAVLPARVGVELFFPKKAAEKKMQIFKTIVNIAQQDLR